MAEPVENVLIGPVHVLCARFSGGIAFLGLVIPHLISHLVQCDRQQEFPEVGIVLKGKIARAGAAEHRMEHRLDDIFGIETGIELPRQMLADQIQ